VVRREGYLDVTMVQAPGDLQGSAEMTNGQTVVTSSTATSEGKRGARRPRRPVPPTDLERSPGDETTVSQVCVSLFINEDLNWRPLLPCNYISAPDVHPSICLFQTGLLCSP